MSTGCGGSARVISASSRPGTRTRPLSVGVHVDLGPRGHLVVEAGDRQLVAVDLEQDPGEDRHRRPRRQAARRPGDGVGEHLTCHPELHLSTHPISSASSMRPARRWQVLRRRCGAHRACCGPSGGNPCPPKSLRSGRLQSCCTRERLWSGAFPTQSVVQGFIEITNSSSSSQVWKLGIGPLRAAQGPNRPVGRLWVVSVFLLSTRGQDDGCAPRSPPLHPLSPASPGSVPRSCPGVARPGRRRPERRTADAGAPRYTRRSAGRDRRPGRGQNGRRDRSGVGGPSPE